MPLLSLLSAIVMAWGINVKVFSYRLCFLPFWNLLILCLATITCFAYARTFTGSTTSNVMQMATQKHYYRQRSRHYPSNTRRLMLSSFEAVETRKTNRNQTSLSRPPNDRRQLAFRHFRCPYLACQKLKQPRQSRTNIHTSVHPNNLQAAATSFDDLSSSGENCSSDDEQTKSFLFETHSEQLQEQETLSNATELWLDVRNLSSGGLSIASISRVVKHFIQDLEDAESMCGFLINGLLLSWEDDYEENEVSLLSQQFEPLAKLIPRLIFVKEEKEQSSSSYRMLLEITKTSNCPTNTYEGHSCILTLNAGAIINTSASSDELSTMVDPLPAIENVASGKWLVIDPRDTRSRCDNHLEKAFGLLDLVLSTASFDSSSSSSSSFSTPFLFGEKETDTLSSPSPNETKKAITTIEETSPSAPQQCGGIAFICQNCQDVYDVLPRLLSSLSFLSSGTTAETNNGILMIVPSNASHDVSTSPRGTNNNSSRPERSSALVLPMDSKVWKCALSFLSAT